LEHSSFVTSTSILGIKAVVKDFGPQTECVYVFCIPTTNCTVVMHRYEILLIIRLADIEIHIIADTDNRSNVYINQNSTYIWQNCHFKNTILVLVMSSRSVKLTV